MQAFDGGGNELMLANYIQAGDSEPGPSTSSGGHQVLLDLAPDWKEKLGLQVAEVAQDLREERTHLCRSQGKQASGMGRAGLGWASGGQGGALGWPQKGRAGLRWAEADPHLPPLTACTLCYELEQEPSSCTMSSPSSNLSSAFKSNHLLEAGQARWAGSRASWAGSSSLTGWMSCPAVQPGLWVRGSPPTLLAWGRHAQQHPCCR